MGRIYVFNLGAEYERWVATGETGRAITRLNYGPSGETVVFDSEEAIDLYNFKHDIAEVVVKPKPPRLEVVWRDGKTRITTDSAYLEMSTRIQTRYTHELPDDAVQLAGTANKGDDKGSFRIRRAKFKLEGWAMKPWLTYEFQINVPAVTGSNAGAILEDASIDVDATKGRNRFRIKFGQFKPAWGRQEMTSSGSQSFRGSFRGVESVRPRPRNRTGLVGHHRQQQDRVARRDLERKQRHPQRQRQRRLPVQRARDVPAQRPPGPRPAGLGLRTVLFRGRLRVRRLSPVRRGRQLREERLPSQRPPGTI
jgi:hypothetical protein